MRMSNWGLASTDTMGQTSDGVQCALHERRSRIRRACGESVSGRTFVLTLWLTCAIATLPSATVLEEVQPLTAFAPPQVAALAQASSAGDRNVPDHTPGGMPMPSRGALTIVSNCWGAARMNVPQAWQLVGAARTTVVAVLDTGIDANNAALEGRIVGRANLVGGTDVADVYGHGTHVAATIASIAPNCTILNVKVVDDRGCCASGIVAEGILRATNWGADVINLSLQVDPSPELEAAIEYAWERGAVVIAAAGTPHPPGLVAQSILDLAPNYPAAYPYVIAVAGTNEDDTIAPLSHRGWWIDVAAPGRRTLAYAPNDQLSLLTGTSSAAAHVSGVAALLCGIAVDRNDNCRVNDEVRHALEWTAEPLGIDGMGRGIVNAQAAVAFILQGSGDVMLDLPADSDPPY